MTPKSKPVLPLFDPIAFVAALILAPLIVTACQLLPDRAHLCLGSWWSGLSGRRNPGHDVDGDPLSGAVQHVCAGGAGGHVGSELLLSVAGW